MMSDVPNRISDQDNPGAKASILIHLDRWKPCLILTALLAFFISCQSVLPLSTAISIGGDEGFELSKALLCLKGLRLYTDIWNDQPPLHTFLITEILKHVSPSILGPRLLTSAFACILLASVFLMATRIHGLAIGAIATALLIASPGFLALGSSCMLEIPALALGVAALCVLTNIQSARWPWTEILAGSLFGLAMEIKLVPMMMLPLAILILWLKQRQTKSPLRSTLNSGIFLGLSLVFVFSATDLIVDRGAFLVHFKQSWISHFAPAKSFEYGSPSDHPFDWRILLKNWDASSIAIFGIVYCVNRARIHPTTIVPVAWLALELVVFSVHKPWWPYYYVHIAAPLCWCASLAIKEFQRLAWLSKKALPVATFFVFALCALLWMGGRLYLQVRTIRNSLQTYSSLVLAQMERYKPFTEYIFADEPVYSFHSGIPMPPNLAVIMLKRLWSGDLTNAKITKELEAIKPGLIILNNDTNPRPFQALLNADYQLVYEDFTVRLYVARSIVHKSEFNP